MPRNLVYYPSGRGSRVRDCCHACGTHQFVGEVVMAYDPQSGAVRLICEPCYRRRQAAAARRFWEAVLQHQVARALDRPVPACACGD
jgi:hypothetical protein